MADRDRKSRDKGSDDLTIQIGEQRFDPVETPVRRRRSKPATDRGETPRTRPQADARQDGGRRGTARAGARRGGAAAGAVDDGGGGPADTRIVQFHRALMNQDIERIRAEYGLALTAYVPNFAYVERVPEPARRRLQRDPLVRAIVPYLPEFKISRSITQSERTQPATVDEGENRLEASLFDRGSTELVVATLESIGAREIVVIDDRPIGGVARVRFVIPASTSLDPVAELDDVRWIEPVARIKLDNVAAASAIQSGDSGNASIWAKGLHGEGQVIGVIDGGPLDINHCFFDDAAPNTPGAGHRKVLAVRNASGTAADGHATFVAGCAAGDERASSGGNGRRGGAWAAKLVSGNNADLGGTSLLAEFTAAMGSGAFIHTNSWHDDTAGRGNPALYNQNAADVDNFTFTNENHVVLGSAGNTGEEQGPPGTAKNAVCVSAAQSGASSMNLGDGNPGPTADLRRKPDLVAVGCAIQSATVSTPCATGPRSACATSYATPHAAAATALIRQYLIEGWYPTGEKIAANSMTPTGALLRAILANATIDMTGVASYPNDSEGWGLVRLDRTLFFPGARRQMTLWDVRHATGPTSRETRTHTIDVDDSTEQLKVTMAFSDPSPAAGSFASPTVNDVDLRVIAPDGTQYIGNDFTNGFSTPNGVAIGDTLNTIETVLVNNPARGKWTIEVQAFRVAVGNPGQGYGLVASATTASGCFIAGTVYGDPDHPEVEALRAWRDRWLRPGARGRAAMLAAGWLYDRIGPPAARAVAGHDRVRAVLRRLWLAPIARRVAVPPPNRVT